MESVATSQMSRMQLTPVASPVNTFVNPGVRAPSSSASQLAELADALGGFNRNLGALSDRLAADSRQAELQRAQATIAKLQIKNQADFKAAVDRGEIERADNPWFAKFADQLVGREEARSMARKIQQDIETNPELRFAESDQIAQYIDSQFTPALQGRDDAVVGAMLAEIEPFKEQQVNRQVALRRQDREVATRSGFQKEIAAATLGLQSALTDNTVDELEAKTAATAIQTAIDNALAVGVRPEEVEQWAKGQMIQAATTYKNTGVYDILNRVSVNGQPIQDDGVTRKALQEAIEDAVAQDEQRGWQREAREMRRQQDIVQNTAIQLIEAQRNGTKPVDLTQVNVAIESLPPEMQAQVRQVVRGLAEETNRDIVGNLVNRGINPLEGPPDPTETDVFTLLRAFGGTGAQAVESIKAARKRDEEALWKETQPETLSRLYSMVNNSNATYEEIARAADAAAEAGTLDRLDYIGVLDRAISRGNLGRDESAVVEGTVNAFELNMRSWVMNTPGNPYVVPTGPNQYEMTPAGNLKISQMVNDANNSFWNDIYRKVPVDQAIKNLQAKTGQMLNDFVGGGSGPQLIQQINEKQQIKDAATSAEKRSLVKFDATEGTLVTSSGAPIDPSEPLFESPKDLLDNAAVFLVDKNIDIKSPAAERILIKQGEVLGAEGRAAAYEALITAREGRDAYKDVRRSLKFIDSFGLKPLKGGIERYEKMRTQLITEGRQSIGGFMGVGRSFTKAELDQLIKWGKDTQRMLEEMKADVAARKDTRSFSDIQSFILNDLPPAPLLSQESTTNK